jgi:hypothetical protein
MYLNLTSLLTERLVHAGIRRHAIHLPNHCTICDGRFHSLRRDGPNSGHGALIAALR